MDTIATLYPLVLAAVEGKIHVALAALGSGIGIGLLGMKAAEATGRNPGAAGNVLTIEPGLYFIEPLLRAWRADRDPALINWDKIDELAPYGGIRIEDNVHVTEVACENLTRTAFAEL